MKYNPKVNEEAARLPGFAQHPPASSPSDGAGRAGADVRAAARCSPRSAAWTASTLQPAAGAHGELTGMLMIRAYHAERGDAPRTQGADSRLARTAPIPPPPRMAASKSGAIPVRRARQRRPRRAPRRARRRHVAALMITNPEHARPVRRAHPRDRSRSCTTRAAWSTATARTSTPCSASRAPGDLGFDVMHFNLHKTFTTPARRRRPRRRAGRRARRISCRSCPVPRRASRRRRRRRLRISTTTGPTIDRPDASASTATSACWCAPTRTSARTGPGLRQVGETAVLNANYLRAAPAATPTTSPYDRLCMHEFVSPAAARRRARRAHARHRQAPARLRHPPADDLLPARRRRGA